MFRVTKYNWCSCTQKCVSAAHSAYLVNQNIPAPYAAEVSCALLHFQVTLDSRLKQRRFLVAEESSLSHTALTR